MTSGSKAGGEDAGYQHILPFMLAPTWLVIGIFLVALVIIMALYLRCP